jgi:hypothetical protein
MKSLGWGSGIIAAVALVLSALYLAGLDRPRRLFAWVWAFDSMLPAAIVGAVFASIALLAFRRARRPSTQASTWGARLGWGLIAAVLAFALFAPVGCSVGFHVPPPNTRCDTVIGISLSGGHDILGWIEIYAFGLPLALLAVTPLVLAALGLPRRHERTEGPRVP